MTVRTYTKFFWKSRLHCIMWIYIICRWDLKIWRLHDILFSRWYWFPLTSIISGLKICENWYYTKLVQAFLFWLQLLEQMTCQFLYVKHIRCTISKGRGLRNTWALLCLNYHIIVSTSQKIRPVFCFLFTVTIWYFDFFYDQIFFGTQHGKMYLTANCLGLNCASGMSTLFRKEIIETAGGLAHFGKYLAEDYLLAQAVLDR